MKAFVVKGPKEYSVELIDIPKPLNNEVLVKLETSGVCHTDLHIANNDWPRQPKYPMVPGHEGIGIVTKIGPNCKKIKVGDRVGIGYMFSACGQCEYCVGGKEILCPSRVVTSLTKPGTFAQYTIGNEDYVLPIPNNLDILGGAPILCGGVTSYKALKQANLKVGDYVAIIGIGGLGHFAIAYAKAMGLNIIAIDINNKKLESAKNEGAHYTFNANYFSLVEQIKSITNGGVHAVINTSVATNSAILGMSILRRAGKQVLVGVPPKDKNNKIEFPLSILATISGEQQVLGSVVGTRQDTKEALALGEKGIISKVGQVISLEQIGEVFEKLSKGELIGRAVIDFRINK
ncbi:Alcohol dehydrogenase [Metamycoplasma auris 15026]|uniref:Alcohol dehydrogenase n=1 Tax=Metamycoplasma auris 15026 TaxID=1188233 RepID=N9VD10_9BACT|nr:Alcohol dehydrogenase [Metamycoplasma auris 15026]